MTWAAVLTAVLELAGEHAVLLAQTDGPWPGGRRHTATLYFVGVDAIEIGTAFIAELPSFPDLPGHKVLSAKTLWQRITSEDLAFQVEIITQPIEREVA